VSGVADWETWWDTASDEERAQFLDDSLDIHDGLEPARRVRDVLRDLADYQPAR